MIKFVIGLIALIFVALAVYTYTDKKAEVVPKSAVTHDVVKKEVAETKLSQPVKVAKEVQHIKSKTEKKLLVEKKDLVQNNEQKKVVVDDYGIGHPRYDVDEEQILLEINNKSNIQLSKDFINKIELEIKNSPLSQ